MTRVTAEMGRELSRTIRREAFDEGIPVPEYTRRALTVFVGLPEKTKQIIALVGYGMSDAEIAATLGILNNKVGDTRRALGLSANKRFPKDGR